MTTTFIDTTQCPRVSLGEGQGEVAEIINKELCGAESVVAMLHWLDEGQHLDADSKEDAHQLYYFLEGDGVISVGGEDYEVGKGAGIYLGPDEAAVVRHRGSGRVKLLHLHVPIQDA